jgi:UDP-GlcNAc:undecaprenyl-phosphate GlcNAc-1-phosphate transferase
MYLPLVIGGFLVSFLTTLVLTPVAIRFAYRKKWIDEPDGRRKLHRTPVPRVGGLVILVGFLVALLYFAIVGRFAPESVAQDIRLPHPIIIGAAILVAFVGTWDDLRGMHFLPKLGLQVIVASLTVFSGIRFTQIGDPFGEGLLVLPFWLAGTLSVIWIVAVINATNLLDGMDGLAAGVAVIVLASLTASYIALGSWTSAVLVVGVIGATLGFLRYNFNPARIFMGDAGSMFLGYMLAVYSILGAGRAQSVLAVIIPLMAMALPLADTLLAVVRRLVARRPLFEADHDHIHHRVSRTLQLSHRNTVLFLYAISAGFGVAATLLAVSRRVFADYMFSVAVLVVTGFGIFLLVRNLGYIALISNPRNNQVATESAATGKEKKEDVVRSGGAFSRSSWSDIDRNGEERIAESTDSK